MCSRMSFSTSNNTMQASPRTASPTLQKGCGCGGGPRGKGVGGGEERGVAGEGVEGKEAGSKHGFSLWLLFPFTEPGFLYTVLELVIFLPQHLE